MSVIMYTFGPQLFDISLNTGKIYTEGICDLVGRTNSKTDSEICCLFVLLRYYHYTITNGNVKLLVSFFIGENRFPLKTFR